MTVRLNVHVSADAHTANGSPMSTPSDKHLWEAYCHAADAMVAARRDLIAHADDLAATIGDALVAPPGRACALQLLLALPPEMSRPHIARLVELATFSQRDIAVSRQIISRLHDADAMAAIAEAVEGHLAAGGEWEFRRVAELYEGFDGERHAAHLRRCALHADEAVREIAADHESDRSEPRHR